MKYLFNDYMKYLKESTKDSPFSEEVRDFLSNLPYGKFEEDFDDVIFKINIDSIKRIGDYEVRVYPEDDGFVCMTFSLNSADKNQGLVTLFESQKITTSNKDYQKYFKKFINTVTKIVTDLSTLS